MRNPYFCLFAALATVMLVSCLAGGAEESTLKTQSTEELIRLLEDIQGSDDRFQEVVLEFESRGASAAEAAPALARALAYDRRDSSFASYALVAMGPAAAPAIPELLRNLGNQRGDVRQYSAFVLGIIAAPSSCSVPELASLLWDRDPAVRSVAAAAIQAITNEKLVQPYDELDPAIPGSVGLDEPDGHVSGMARSWWLDVGRHRMWPAAPCNGAGP